MRTIVKANTKTELQTQRKLNYDKL